MDPATARAIAYRSHAGQFDRFGQPVIEHVERVAQAVTPEDRTIAFLHDVLERTDTTADDLIDNGLTATELAVLDLLSRLPGESYEAHTLRIAKAPGAPGERARRIKLADLDDHLERGRIPTGAPPYGWARVQLASA